MHELGGCWGLCWSGFGGCPGSDEDDVRMAPAATSLARLARRAVILVVVVVMIVVVL
jgi:hypothetical protein